MLTILQKMVADTAARRSSRTKPTSTAVNGKPPASKSKALPPINGKRPASEEPEKPRSKRAKNGTVEPTAKPARKAPAKKTTTSKPAAPRAPKVALNALPRLNDYVESGQPNQMFVWGAGNFGQFGMGPDLLDEYSKPKKNAWVEKKVEEGAFGEAGAGIAVIAAGGLHTLFVDEKGTVRRFASLSTFNLLSLEAGMVLRRE